MSDTASREGPQAIRAVNIVLWVLQAVLEVAGAAGLLIPRLSGLAALGLACLMVGLP